MKINYFFTFLFFFSLNSVFSQQTVKNEIDGQNIVTDTGIVSYVNTYPNPSEGFIRINVAANFREVILKAKTRELYTLPADNKIVDVSELPKGIYTIQIATVDRIYFSKLYKK